MRSNPVSKNHLLEQTECEQGQADGDVLLVEVAGGFVKLRHHLSIVDDGSRDELWEEQDEKA